MKIKRGLLGLLVIGTLLPLFGGIVAQSYFTDRNWIQVPLHSSVEAIGACVAIVLGTLIFIIRRHAREASPYVYTGYALLGMGILNGFHSISPPGNSFVFLKSAATFTGGLFFSMTWLPAKSIKDSIRVTLPYIITFSAVALGAFSLASPELLPKMIDGMEFTQAAKIINFAGGILFLAAAVRFVGWYLRDENNDDILLSYLCLFFSEAGVLFGLSKAWNAEWWLSHMLSLLAYIIVFIFIFLISRWAREKIKEANTALKERLSEIEKVNEELKRFTETVSHDLKNPMTSIAGMSEVLYLNYGDSLDEKAKHCVERIKENTDIMNELLSGLLELSRIGRIEEKDEKVDTGHLIKHIIGEHKHMIEKDKITVKVDEEMPTLCFSRARFYQIFSNLFNNALKFTRDDVAPEISIGCDCTGPECVFFLKDNGIGIDEEHHEIIFDMFSRVKEKEVEGRGIGLSIVKKILDDRGGRIWLESKKGEGSTFYVAIKKS